ncbi:MAG: MFS transporter [Nocardioides sp.]
MSGRPHPPPDTPQGPRSQGPQPGLAPGPLLALSIAAQAAVSIASWGLGSLGPALQEHFGVTATGLGALLAASFVGNALVLLPAGRIVDRHGPRHPLIVGGLAGSGFLLLAAAGDRLWIAGIALVGYGAAAAFVAIAGQVAVFHGFPADRRGTALGVRQMAVSAGGLIAAGLLPGLAVIGGVGLALSVAGVLAGLCATAFGLAHAAGPVHEAGLGRPDLDITGLLRTPGIVVLCGIAVAQVTALTCLLNFSVPALRDLGASALAGSALFAVASTGAMAARVGWGRVADIGSGCRRRTTLRDIGITTTIGAICYWSATPLGPTALLPAMLVFAFGALGANGVVYLVAGELVGPDRTGQATGLLSMAFFGGSALVSIPLGLLADQVGFRSLWLVAATCGLIAAGLSYRLPADRITRSEPPATARPEQRPGRTGPAAP